MRAIKMNEKEMLEKQKEYIRLIENKLSKAVPQSNAPYGKINEAMRYSLLSGGKRIRPVFCLEFCRAVGGDILEALPFACSLEMIHNYSLIHDDLPCMDNDDLRRGKPTNHKVFGEGMATLAGDALLNRAFENLFFDIDNIKNPYKYMWAVRELSNASGIEGMIGGQVIDLSAEGTKPSIETLTVLQHMKTGALFCAAAKIGCIIGGANEDYVVKANSFALDLGLAFQIKDDILDVEGEETVLGKKIGRDKASDKYTFVTYLGLDKAKKTVRDLTESAIDKLNYFTDNSMLKFLTIQMLNRQS
jgi:geranylgeranyl diphosphate synthase type II